MRAAELWPVKCNSTADPEAELLKLARDSKVLIAGAGPVGMYAALALTRRGIPVQIVDTGLWACSHSYALALHPQSLELMKKAGLVERIWDSACVIRRIGLYDDRDQRAEIRLEDENSAGAMAVMRQSALEDMLLRELEDAGTPVEWRHELSRVRPHGDRLIANIDELDEQRRGYVVANNAWAVSNSTDLEVDLVLGADGHDSQVRRAAAIEFPEIAPAEYYAVFEFRSDADLGGEMRIAMGERTTDVLWPLPDHYCRWSFQLPDYSDMEAEQLKERLLAGGFGHFPTPRLKDRVPAVAEWGSLPILEVEHLRALIAERAPWFRGSIEALSWRTIVRFERRLAKAFGKGRLWLAGDAAHLGAPIGVQSMNTGLLEADDLTARFERILNGSEYSTELEAYSGHWTPVWRQLHGLEGGIGATKKTDAWVRDHANRLLPCLPGCGDEAASLLRQLRLEFV